MFIHVRAPRALTCVLPSSLRTSRGPICFRERSTASHQAQNFTALRLGGIAVWNFPRQPGTHTTAVSIALCVVKRGTVLHIHMLDPRPHHA
jgi:hypothetical protein